MIFCNIDRFLKLFNKINKKTIKIIVSFQKAFFISIFLGLLSNYSRFADIDWTRPALPQKNQEWKAAWTK